MSSNVLLYAYQALALVGEGIDLAFALRAIAADVERFERDGTSPGPEDFDRLVESLNESSRRIQDA